MNTCGVIFDMDGLMLDTESISWKSWQKAVSDCGLEPMSKNTFIQMVGCRMPDIVKNVQPLYGERTREIIEIAEHHYHTLLETDPPAIKKGLLPLLDWLEEMNIPKAVATSSGPNGANRKLTNSGLKPRFTHIVTGDQVKNGKPAPDIFLKASSMISRKPESCYVLEDSRHGIMGAHRAGARPIMVPDLVPPDENLRAIALAICADLDEARKVIEETITS